MNKVILFLPSKAEVKKYAFLLITERDVYFGIMHKKPEYAFPSVTADRVSELLAGKVDVRVLLAETKTVTEIEPDLHLLNFTLGKVRRLTSDRIPSNRAVYKVVGGILARHKMGFMNKVIMKQVKTYVNKADAAE